MLTGSGSTYTISNATLELELRGISGSANNTYSPPLGQGFQIVTAPGGVLGSFNPISQPLGLLPGTRFDTVYGTTTLNLYVTPESYASLSAAGVATNSNRQQIGDILQPIRPTAGIRESDATRKFLFDSLAPQTTTGLAVAMDQLGGVSYGQLIGMNFENSKFLADQMARTVALHRRGEGEHLIVGDTGQATAEPQEEVWGIAIGRLSDWRGDNVGYNTYDVLGGVMGGIQKRLNQQSLAGSILAGWSNETTHRIRYETGIGINYLGMRYFGFNDSGNQNAYALTTQTGNTESLVPNLNATMSVPFDAYQIDWRAYALTNVGYETAANKITLQSNFLDNPISVDSGSIGRTRVNLGLGISGHVGRETRVALEVSNQSAQNWNATAANISVRLGF